MLKSLNLATPFEEENTTGIEAIVPTCWIVYSVPVGMLMQIIDTRAVVCAIRAKFHLEAFRHFYCRGQYMGSRIYAINLQSVPHFTLESFTPIAARPPIAPGRTRQTEFFDNEVTGRIDCFFVFTFGTLR